MNDNHITLKEWCAANHISRSQVYVFLARGDLTAIKIGRRTFVSPEASKQFFSSRAPFESRAHVGAA